MKDWKQSFVTITVKNETLFDYPGPYSRRKTNRIRRQHRLTWKRWLQLVHVEEQVFRRMHEAIYSDYSTS